MQPAESEFSTSQWTYRVSIAENFVIEPSTSTWMQPIPGTFNSIDFHFDPVTSLGYTISPSGIDVLYNIPTRQISAISSGNNQGIPYSIQLSPEDERFILASIHYYERSEVY